jgi:hypothetical protein
MRPRSLLIATTAAVAFTALPLTADAAEGTYIDRANYDATVDRTDASLRVAAATRGDLGGYLDMTLTADDGTLPTGSNVCEPATLDAVLTIAPAETFAVHTTAEACTTFSGDSIQAFAGFGAKDLEYTGTHKKAKLADREGFLSIGVIDGFGGQAAFSANVRW